MMARRIQATPFHILFLILLQCISARDIHNPVNVETRGETNIVEPLAEADILVVGTGVGGTGFLRRFASLQPNATVLWFDKGWESFVARNWPDDLNKKAFSAFDSIPRKQMKWQPALAWNAFGGGDTLNSGGPNYLGMDESDREKTYEPVDVWALRNYSITPPTNNTDRWLTAFLESGYEGVCPIKSRSSDLGVATVGQVSSMRTSDGRDRQLFAYPLRFSNDNHITFVHARITRVLHDDDGRAIGVEGVRLDADQREYGGLVTWQANKAVVLAGGVMNTFSLLVESGIGPKDMLHVRGIKDVWVENEYVGKNVGDELTAILLHVEPDKTDVLGSEPRIAASNSTVSLTYWGSAFQFYFPFENFIQFNIFGLLSWKFPKLNYLVLEALTRISFWGIGVASGPVMNLEAVEIPKNNTRKGRRRMKTNPLGIVIDDTQVKVTDEMCADIYASFTPLEKGLNMLKKASKKPSIVNFLLATASKLGLTNLVKPRPVTAQNIKKYTKKGKKCDIGMLGSYYHFYGGAGEKVVDNYYRVRGATGLYISDASVLTNVSAGAPSSLIMQEGMRVADAVHSDL